MSKPASETEGPPNVAPRKRKITPSSSSPPDESSQQSRNRQAVSNAAPLYITIGPQCCGKSSLLKTLDGGKITDISLDDQPDVYVPVPANVFLDCFVGKQAPTLLQQVLQGKTLQERIQNDNSELGLILQRWSGDVGSDAFGTAMRELYVSRNFPVEVAEQLVTAVEQCLTSLKPDGQSLSMPKTVDVFILESLFRPHPDTNKSAIQKAQEELRTTPKHIPIAWGNTNSKSRDYTQALEIAWQTRRPVRFVLCHPSLPIGDDDSQLSQASKLLSLPWIELPDLLKRNLKRLKETGRYIPAFAVADCCNRIQSLIHINDTERIDTVEQRLVSLGSPFFMNENNGRQHRQQHQQRRPRPFKYALSEHHLIQKIYPQSSGQQGRGDGNRGTRGSNQNYNGQSKSG